MFSGAAGRKKAPSAATGDDDYIDDDEEQKYLGGGFRFGEEDPPRPKKKMLIDEDDDDFIPPIPTLEVPSGKVMSLPIQNSAFRYDERIPLKVKLAAQEVFEHCKKVTVNIKDLASKYGTDVQVDPLVSMVYFADTGSCKIHLKEVVPISTYLLLCVLGCTYFVQVTPKAKTAPELFSIVPVKPFKGNQGNDNVQTFGTEEILTAKVEPELMEQVKAYMLSLGPLSSVTVSDREWINEQLESFKQILDGKLVPLQDDKRLRDRVN
jgi:hypothetical protein